MNVMGHDKFFFASKKDVYEQGSSTLLSSIISSIRILFFLFSILFAMGCSGNLFESVSKDGEVFPGKTSARSLTESADIYYSQGDMVRARELYNQALAADPQYAPAMEGLVGVDTDIFFKTNFGTMYPQIANFSTFITMIVENSMRSFSYDNGTTDSSEKGLGLTTYSIDVIGSNNMMSALTAEQITLITTEVDKQVARLSALAEHSRSSMTTLALLKSYTLINPLLALVNYIQRLELLVHQLKDNGANFYADMQKFTFFEPTNYMVITNPTVDTLGTYHNSPTLIDVSIDNSQLINQITEIQNAYQRNLYVYRFFNSTNFATRQAEIYALQTLLQPLNAALIDSSDGVYGQVTGGLVKIKNKIDKLAAEISDAKKAMYSEHFRLQTLAMFPYPNPDMESVLDGWRMSGTTLTSAWILAKYGYTISISSVNFSTAISGAQPPYYYDLTYCGTDYIPGYHPFDDGTGFNSTTEPNYFISDYWYFPCTGPNRFIDASL